MSQNFYTYDENTVSNRKKGLEILRKYNNNKFPKIYIENHVEYTDISSKTNINQSDKNELNKHGWDLLNNFWVFLTKTD